jgi:hypothetical protein
MVSLLLMLVREMQSMLRMTFFGGSGGWAAVRAGVVTVLVRSTTMEFRHLYALAGDIAFSMSRGFLSSMSIFSGSSGLVV